MGLVSACNTIEGAGEDIEQAGDEIEEATSS
jgi:predicted small secreted protein